MPQKSVEHLPLATAAAVVYRQVIGAAVDEVRSGDAEDILNHVARALSNVAPIYALDPRSGKPSPLAPFDLIEATFVRGATLLIGRGGVEYRELSIEREDMRSAIAILKAANISFPRASRS